MPLFRLHLQDVLPQQSSADNLAVHVLVDGAVGNVDDTLAATPSPPFMFSIFPKPGIFPVSYMLTSMTVLHGLRQFT